MDRQRRVAELLRRALSKLIAREVGDRLVKMLSITQVTVSRDLKRATVYVSSVERDADPDAIEDALHRAGGYLRRKLAREVHLKTTPDLAFKYDASIRRGVEMTQLIDSLAAQHADS